MAQVLNVATTFIDGYDQVNVDPNAEYDLVVQSYGVGSYEGVGIAVVMHKGKWGSVDLCHCSCYGPWENGVALNHDSLESLISVASSGQQRRLSELAVHVRVALGEELLGVS